MFRDQVDHICTFQYLPLVHLEVFLFLPRLYPARGTQRFEDADFHPPASIIVKIFYPSHAMYAASDYIKNRIHPILIILEQYS